MQWNYTITIVYLDYLGFRFSLEMDKVNSVKSYTAFVVDPEQSVSVEDIRFFFSSSKSFLNVE